MNDTPPDKEHRDLLQNYAHSFRDRNTGTIKRESPAPMIHRSSFRSSRTGRIPGLATEFCAPSALGRKPLRLKTQDSEPLSKYLGLVPHIVFNRRFGHN